MEFVNYTTGEDGKNFTVVYKSAHGCIDYAVSKIMDFLMNHHIIIFLAGVLTGLFLLFYGL